MSLSVRLLLVEITRRFSGIYYFGNYSISLWLPKCGRVAEVSARFTLDSLPGKQMAIDADLNAGLINQEQAIKRRIDVAQEADFYGSMDGASKFVRGDAIAGILVLVINMIGGLIIGMLQHDMSFF